MVRWMGNKDRLVCTLPTIYMDDGEYRRFHIWATPHPAQIMILCWGPIEVRADLYGRDVVAPYRHTMMRYVQSVGCHDRICMFGAGCTERDGCTWYDTEDVHGKMYREGRLCCV